MGRAMKSSEENAGGDERLGEALPIEGAPAVWHDEPPPDDYLVEVDATDDLAPEPVSPPTFTDPVSLRPAWPRVGSRRPRPRVAPVASVTPEVDAPASSPPVTWHPQPSGGRPLPRVGTEALGRCFRVEGYGAFIEFTGHRGLIHISQINPGTHVDRVTDVIGVGDEVVVRVIAVDYVARHVNLSLIRLERRRTSTPPAPLVRRVRVPDAVAPPSPQLPPMIVEAAEASTPADAVQEAASAPTPVSPAKSIPEAVSAAPTPPVIEAVAPIANVTASAPKPVEASKTIVTPPTARVTPPTPIVRPSPRSRDVVPYVPPAPPRSAEPAARPASAADARRAPATRRVEIARAGAHAMRRELVDPNHPMARLLASSPTMGAPTPPQRPVAPKRLTMGSPVARASTPTMDDDPVETPREERLVPTVRPVHVEESEPDPISDQPATIEALAARFGAKAPSTGRTTGPTSRSQAAREAQARMLDELRRQG
jgi:predicted RNA-binding protein with RPS1 domain